MTRGLEYLSYMLKEVGVFSPEKKSLWGDLTATFQNLKWAYEKDEDPLSWSIMIEQGVMV